ncbi:MAG: TonB family protein [Gemmatimonadales bacterium]|nr:TonB family protein [Gemmatimonadales bacterium]NIN13551.1 TonB family protein [Gemmatimonadales bacterium]NIR01102.1 TonB family protein [Gemmatimonadales bacterium]
MTLNLRSLVGVTLLCAALACGGSRTSTKGAIEPEWYRDADTCAPARFPATLPTLDALVDSAAVLPQLARSGPRDVPPSVLALRFDGDGVAAPVAVLDTHLPREEADSLAVLIASHLRPQRPGQLWGVRLHVSHATLPALSIHRSEFCPPKPTGPVIRVPFQFEGTPEDLEDFRRAGPYHVVALVSSAGAVDIVRLVRSSRSNIMDRLALESVRQLRFEPARLDGAPVPAWFDVRSSKP